MSTDTQHHSAISHYFQQALHGKNTLFSWCFGFWFIMFCWVVGQLLLGIPLVLAAIETLPNGLQELMEDSQADAQADMSPAILLFAILSAIATLTAVITGFLGASKEAGRGQGLRIVASLCMAFTGIGFIMMMASGSGEDTKFITDAIAKSPMVLLFMLLTFVPLIIGTLMSTTIVHLRKFKTVLTAHTHFRWSRVFFAFALTGVISGAVMIISHYAGLNPIKYSFDPTWFFKYLPILLLLIPLQSAAEEIVLRGYMNQGLGQYIRNPWIVFAITSALFMSLHLSNPEVSTSAGTATHYFTIFSYFAFGMMACVLTYIDGGLESAIGVHVGNNLYLSTIMGYPDSALPTPTVVQMTPNASTDMFVGIASMLVLIFILHKTRKPLDVDVPAPSQLQTFE